MVAGLNYKFTLAILENDENSSSSGSLLLCRGFLRGITVYKPLPHTGQGLSVTSWGKPLDCDTDAELMKLLHDTTTTNDNDATTPSEDEEAKENALVVEDAMEEAWEEAEPNT